MTQGFLASPGEYGNDFSLNVGSPIQAPFAGVFHSEDNGKSAWGKRAFVVAPNGSTFAVGHLTAFGARNGQAIAKGQTVGYSGGAKSDPSSGNTTGPHVEIQFLNQLGNYINPQHVFAQFPDYFGTIFGHPSTATQTYGMAAYTAAPAASSPGLSSAIANKPATKQSGAQQAMTGTGPLNFNIQWPAIKWPTLYELITGQPATSEAWFYRGMFTVVGGVMILVGVILYFKGDEVKQFMLTAAQDTAKAGEVAAV